MDRNQDSLIADRDGPSQTSRSRPTLSNATLGMPPKRRTNPASVSQRWRPDLSMYAQAGVAYQLAYRALSRMILFFKINDLRKKVAERVSEFRAFPSFRAPS